MNLLAVGWGEVAKTAIRRLSPPHCNQGIACVRKPFSPCGRMWLAEGESDEGVWRATNGDWAAAGGAPHPVLRTTFSREGRRNRAMVVAPF